MELPDLNAFDSLLLVALGKLIERQLPGTDTPEVGRLAAQIAEEAYKQRAEALRRIEDKETTPGLSQEVGVQGKVPVPLPPGGYEEL